MAANSVKNIVHISAGITEYFDMLRHGAELYQDIADLDLISYF